MDQGAMDPHSNVNDTKPKKGKAISSRPNAFINGRPKTRAAVYRIARHAIHRIHDEIATLESGYYNSKSEDGTSDEVAFINQAMGHIRQLALTAASQLNNGIRESGEQLAGGFVLTGSSQVDDLCFEAASTGSRAISVTDDLDEVRKLSSHVLEYTLHRLGPLLDHVTETLEFLQRFCPSFWETSSFVTIFAPVMETQDSVEDLRSSSSSPADETCQEVGEKKVKKLKRRKRAEQKQWNLLKTPNSYERYRMETVHDINNRTAKIRNQTLEFSSKGVSLDQYEPQSENLAEKTRSRAAPFLILFPNAISVIRTLCEQLQDWINADKYYAVQLKEDLEQIHLQHAQVERKYRKAEESMGYWNYREARLAREISGLRDLIASMHQKREQIQVQCASAELEVDKLDVLVNTNKMRLDQLRYDYIERERMIQLERDIQRKEAARQKWHQAKMSVRIRLHAKFFTNKLSEMRTDSVADKIRRQKDSKSENEVTQNILSQHDKLAPIQGGKHRTESECNAKALKKRKSGVVIRPRPVSVSMQDIEKCRARLAELTRTRLPAATRRKQEAMRRMSWFVQKDKCLVLMQQCQEQQEKSHSKVRSNYNYLRNLLEKLDKSILIVHRIREWKTNSRNIRKIAHNMELPKLPIPLDIPIDDLRGKMQKSEKSLTTEEKKFNAIVHFVAERIGPDWRALFYSLPFEPARGLVEMENLIAHIDQRMARADCNELGLQALLCWRRLHFTANPQMLCAALEKINRSQLSECIIQRYKISPHTEEMASFDEVGRIDVEREDEEGDDINGTTTVRALTPPMSALGRTIQRLIRTPRTIGVLNGCATELRVHGIDTWNGLPVALTAVPKRKAFLGI